MKEVQIYALVDPYTKEIRYVGKTVKKISYRLSNHIYNAKVTKHNKHLSNWILKLLDKGKKPLIISLESCNESNWQEKEKYWIAKFDNLINITEGGDGSVGYTHSIEVRKKISDAAKKRKCSEERKKQCSEFFKNIPRTETWKKNISKSLKGKKASEQAKKNLSEAHKGYVMPEAQKEKIRKALKGRKRPKEVVEKIKASHIARANKMKI